MNILHALVLGLVQGLGEFLPISSSAHLIVVPWLFNWPDPGLGYDVALHWGTLLAVLVYFRWDVYNLIRGFWHSLFKSTRDASNIYQKLAWLIIIASVPGAVLGKLLEAKAEEAFRSPLLIAATLSGFAAILLVADFLGKKIKNLDKISGRDALLIGLSQALAVIPGVSRSGSTIASGLGLGFKREDAARFSFLMSMPIIFGAGLTQFKNFGKGASHIELAVGFLSAAVFGFLSIKYMLRYIVRHDFRIFAWYRIVIAIVILAVFFLRKG